MSRSLRRRWGRPLGKIRRSKRPPTRLSTDSINRAQLLPIWRHERSQNWMGTANVPHGYARWASFWWPAVHDLAMKMSRRSSSAAPHKKQTKPGKERIDLLLVAQGLAPSRERAQALVLAGQIRVNGAKVDKAGTQGAADARIEIAGEMQRYSSRGGLKLEGALQDFNLSPQDRICMDVGSSTGGFTDCLLQNGASKVFAVDVTIDQLDWKLRQDARVATVEKNARYLLLEDIGGQVD